VTRRRSEPRRVGAVLPRLLGELGFGAARTAMQAQACWPAVVGEAAAAHSGVEALRGRTLEVAVDSSVWGQQLQIRTAEILAALRERLGDDAPAELRFRLR
jgi:predicted nucleic acid-binding Zn ribbon protein